MLLKVSELLEFIPKKKFPQTLIDDYLKEQQNKQYSKTGHYVGDRAGGDATLSWERYTLTDMLLKYGHLPNELQPSVVLARKADCFSYHSFGNQYVSNFSVDFNNTRLAALKDIVDIADILGYGIFPIQFLLDIQHVAWALGIDNCGFSPIKEFIDSIALMDDRINTYVLCPKDLYSYSLAAINLNKYTKYLSPKLAEELSATEMMLPAINMLYNMIYQMGQELDSTRQNIGKAFVEQMSAIIESTAMAKSALNHYQNISYDGSFFAQRAFEAYNRAGQCPSVAGDILRQGTSAPTHSDFSAPEQEMPYWATTETKISPKVGEKVNIKSPQLECLVFACPDLSKCSENQIVIIGGDIGSKLDSSLFNGTQFSQHRHKSRENVAGIK